MKIQTIGLFVNQSKEAGLQLVPRVVSACSAMGFSLVAEPVIQTALVEHAHSIDEVVHAADVLLVLGGDGTILRAISCMRDAPKPILGVNLGTLGFLAECMPDRLEASIARLASGDFHLEPRMLLHSHLDADSTVHTALNDVVITRGSFARMLQVDTFVNGTLAARYEGDGAIIASPTGSTAYSLSAGGPIVAPDMDCFVLVPICPHTLSSRPIVVSASAQIRMEIIPREEDGGMLLSIDGAQCRILHEKSVLHIRRSDRVLPFIRFGENKFYALLRNKLSQWGDAMLLDESPEH